MKTLVDPSRSVAELLLENPARARVFEARRIDFCCGGKKPLSEACASRGINTDQVLEELADADNQRTDSSGVDWSTRSCKDLIDHIVIFHHAFLRGELPRLAALAAKVARVHGPHFPAMVELSTVFNGLRAELESHMQKEEQVLFPFVETLEAGKDSPFPTIGLPISCMEHEHDSAGAALEKMRELTAGYQLPAEACNSWRVLYEGLRELEADLHAHIHKENNILFPRALAMETALRGRTSTSRYTG